MRIREAGKGSGEETLRPRDLSAGIISGSADDASDDDDDEEEEKRICLDQRGLVDFAVYVIERSHFMLARLTRRSVTFAILCLIDDFVFLSLSPSLSLFSRWSVGFNKADRNSPRTVEDSFCPSILSFIGKGMICKILYIGV